MEPELMEMGFSLTQLVAKGTASVVDKKIRAVKEIKETEKVRAAYDEILNELLLEREEAVRIAQAYKSELDRIVISDKDIEHLHNTATRLIEWITAFQLIDALTKGEAEVAKVQAQAESFEQLKNLISVDTMKAMQLLGFNYKAAIG